MKKLVWIVDDDEGILEVTQIVLEEAGFDVRRLPSYEELCEALYDTLPHLILLDVSISGKDGTEIAKELKNTPQTGSIPIVMMSADANIDVKTREGGADSFIKKPFDIQDLEKKVRKYTE
jgi:DNA-binding response OmpR family regulator